LRLALDERGEQALLVRNPPIRRVEPGFQVRDVPGVIRNLVAENANKLGNRVRASIRGGGHLRVSQITR
jgi:hypothetical protein